jgi:hypothetical protein
LAFFKSKLVLGLITGFWFGFLKILIKKYVGPRPSSTPRVVLYIWSHASASTTTQVNHQSKQHPSQHQSTSTKHKG